MSDTVSIDYAAMQKVSQGFSHEAAHVKKVLNDIQHQLEILLGRRAHLHQGRADHHPGAHAGASRHPRLKRGRALQDHQVAVLEAEAQELSSRDPSAIRRQARAIRRFQHRLLVDHRARVAEA